MNGLEAINKAILQRNSKKCSLEDTIKESILQQIFPHPQISSTTHKMHHIYNELGKKRINKKPIANHPKRQITLTNIRRNTNRSHTSSQPTRRHSKNSRRTRNFFRIGKITYRIKKEEFTYKIPERIRPQVENITKHQFT